MKPTTGRSSVLRWAMAVFAMAAAAGHAAPPSAEDFARPAAIRSVKLSPSGQRLALLVSSPKGRSALAVMDLPLDKPPRTVAAYADADIRSYSWINDDRLLYNAVDFDDGVEVRTDRAGTFAVDHDGENLRQLIAHRWHNDGAASRVQSRVLTYQWRTYATIDNGSSDIWVYEQLYDNRDQPTGAALAKLDTRTGQLRRYLAGSPEHTGTWLFGQDGEPAIAESDWNGRTKLHHRKAAGQPWVMLRDEPFVGGSMFSPVFLEAGRLFVTAREGADTSALYDMDLQTGKLSKEALVAVKGFDLNPDLVVDTRTRKLTGVHFRADRPYSYWFDDDLHNIQQGLDAALPGRFNRLDCARCETSPYLVVTSSSDSHPGEFFLYDRKSRKLSPIGAARPWLPEASQGKRSFHRVTTRDGLEIPVYVTHPPGAKPTDALPAVMLVHGGPWVRGADRSWDAEAQFLASRGYRVLEPEFRGSTGYGNRLFAAGLKQWGGSMQDDLADTVAWAAQRGLVDDKRVCIMGGSYGGYAALMSPILHPAAYRCAVSFAAVTDMELRYKAWDSDLSDQTALHVLPAMMGDPDKDRELLRASSPLLRVKELKIPVLLMHGAKDRRVPLEHAHKFASAAKAAGVALDYHVYDVEGHGFVQEANEADYFRRVEAFLSKHLR